MNYGPEELLFKVSGHGNGGSRLEPTLLDEPERREISCAPLWLSLLFQAAIAAVRSKEEFLEYSIPPFRASSPYDLAERQHESSRLETSSKSNCCHLNNNGARITKMGDTDVIVRWDSHFNEVGD